MEDMEKKLAFLLASSPHFMLKGGPSTYEKAARDFIVNGVVVRKKGEWIRQEGAWRMMESGENVNIHLCSCCGGYFQNAPYNFCPCCGADMRGELE